MPIDAEAAGKTSSENKNKALELGNLTESPGQRMKELVNLDKFKSSIANICQLWLGGIPAPPRRYEQWRSKLVQQEKISFKETTPPIEAATAAPTVTTTNVTGNNNNNPPATAPLTANNSFVMPSTSRSSLINGTKTAATESLISTSPHVTFQFNKRKEPHQILEEMYKHTCDPLPE